LFIGVGGHGGTGINADLNDKYREITQKVMMYAQPDLTKYFDSETIYSSCKDQEEDGESLSRGSQESNEHLIQDIAERFGARNMNFNQSYLQPNRYHHFEQANANNVPQDEVRHQHQQVNVTKCAVCTVL